MEAHDEVVAKEKEKKEGANLLAPPDHDYVVLEAKELMKYFTKEGEPSKEVQVVLLRAGIDFAISVMQLANLRVLLLRTTCLGARPYQVMVKEALLRV